MSDQLASKSDLLGFIESKLTTTTTSSGTDDSVKQLDSKSICSYIDKLLNEAESNDSEQTEK